MVGRLRRGRGRVASGLILLAVSLFVGSVVLPSAGLAAEGDVRGSVRGEGLANTDLGESVLDARLDFEAESGRFLLGGTYRAYEISSRLYNPREVYPDPLGIKHRYAEFNTDDFGLRAGDYFVTFGKGLVLRSFEEIMLEHDTALDGVLGEYRAGSLELTGAAGGMTDWFSRTQAWKHNVYGMRVTASLWDALRLGASGLKRFQRKYDEGVSLPDVTSNFEDVVVGGDAEAWLGPVTLNGEYVDRQGDYYFEGEQNGEPGHGAYFGGTYGGSWLSLLAEYKNYYRFENAVINPPTCIKEHLWTLMNRVTHLVELDDEKGWIIEGVISLPENLTLDGGASEARRRNGDLAHWEMFGQMDYLDSDLLSAALALSWSREYELGKFTEHVSGALDTDISLSEQVIELTIEGQHTEEPSGFTFRDFFSTVAYYPRHNVTVVGALEHTTRDDLERDTWVFVDLRLTIAGRHEVSLGGGTERGGRKCAGGICFDEPEFAGLKVRFLTYF